MNLFLEGTGLDDLISSNLNFLWSYLSDLSSAQEEGIQAHFNEIFFWGYSWAIASRLSSPPLAPRFTFLIMLLSQKPENL